jgi:hypothetical protein
LNLGVRYEPWLPWADASAGKVGSQINLADFANGVHSPCSCAAIPVCLQVS